MSRANQQWRDNGKRKGLYQISYLVFGHVSRAQRFPCLDESCGAGGQSTVSGQRDKGPLSTRSTRSKRRLQMSMNMAPASPHCGRLPILTSSQWVKLQDSMPRCRNLGFHASAQCIEEAVHIVTFEIYKSSHSRYCTLMFAAGPQRFSPR